MEEDGQFVDIFLDFLDVAIQNVLVHRKVYPKGLFSCHYEVAFEKKRKYSIPVFQSTSALLDDYLEKVLTNLRPLLQNKEINRFSVLIFQDERIVERFVFDFEGKGTPD